MKLYTEETFHFDFSNNKIKEILIILESDKKTSDKEFAIKAYNYVRDIWIYNPNKFSLVTEEWKASKLVTHKKGHCIDKVIILATILRAANIPARLGLAKVKNHIAVEDIIKKFGSDVLVPHGYIEIYLEEKWVKATPAFNSKLCELLNVKVLEFDGENDSIFQEYDNTGSQIFMEYIEDYGSFNDVPVKLMINLLYEHYPKIKEIGTSHGNSIDLSKIQ